MEYQRDFSNNANSTRGASGDARFTEAKLWSKGFEQIFALCCFPVISKAEGSPTFYDEKTELADLLKTCAPSL